MLRKQSETFRAFMNYKEIAYKDKMPVPTITAAASFWDFLGYSGKAAALLPGFGVSYLGPNYKITLTEEASRKIDMLLSPDYKTLYKVWKARQA